MSWRSFKELAPGLLAHHGVQPRRHIARTSSAAPGLLWRYTHSRVCRTSTGINPSPIQRKLISRLGRLGQSCPPVSGKGNGQGDMLVSDSHYCRAITTSTSRIHSFPYTCRTSRQTRRLNYFQH
ncbi:hypothetical protein PoB_004606200 [Plakobranchus ocellatus]|uniref:Uncharacterized protein n=1 Tax=Plakobranchus ocellatus TaxID=259542 RepID=A0AAV4BJI8_9GAST|nr:hypothetical protein PoB_004606200 [Plakobranchus ocellatus]